MMRIFKDFDGITAAVGTEVGVSDWIEVTQERIGQFARATGNDQWIHVDVARAERESPTGTTIADGLLTLSPTMRFVAIKSPDQQAVLMLHRTRDLLVRQRTMLVNALRGHLAEYGIIAPQRLPSVPKLMELAEKARGGVLPELAWRCIRTHGLCGRPPPRKGVGSVLTGSLAVICPAFHCSRT
jgi:hypothetical protein